MEQKNEAIFLECKKRLLHRKSEILNGLNVLATSFQSLDRQGDEVDQTVHQIEENNFLLSQRRLKEQLFEIELALSKIENGRYGICEETDELIETDRLLAIPWTRCSIEGAEIREAMLRRFAK